MFNLIFQCRGEEACSHIVPYAFEHAFLFEKAHIVGNSNQNILYGIDLKQDKHLKAHHEESTEEVLFLPSVAINANQVFFNLIVVCVYELAPHSHNQDRQSAEQDVRRQKRFHLRQEEFLVESELVDVRVRHAI